MGTFQINQSSFLGSWNSLKGKWSGSHFYGLWNMFLSKSWIFDFRIFQGEISSFGRRAMTSARKVPKWPAVELQCIEGCTPHPGAIWFGKRLLTLGRDYKCRLFLDNSLLPLHSLSSSLHSLSSSSSTPSASGGEWVEEGNKRVRAWKRLWVDNRNNLWAASQCVPPSPTNQCQRNDTKKWK